VLSNAWQCLAGFVWLSDHRAEPLGLVSDFETNGEYIVTEPRYRLEFGSDLETYSYIPVTQSRNSEYLLVSLVSFYFIFLKNLLHEHT